MFLAYSIAVSIIVVSVVCSLYPRTVKLIISEWWKQHSFENLNWIKLPIYILG